MIELEAVNGCTAKDSYWDPLTGSYGRKSSSSTESSSLSTPFHAMCDWQLNESSLVEPLVRRLNSLCTGASREGKNKTPSSLAVRTSTIARAHRPQAESITIVPRNEMDDIIHVRSTIARSRCEEHCSSLRTLLLGGLLVIRVSHHIAIYFKHARAFIHRRVGPFRCMKCARRRSERSTSIHR